MGTSRKATGILTKTEIKVLRLICEGLSTKAVADKLGMAYGTADTHRANIYRKISFDDGNNVIKVFLWAIKNGYVAAPKFN
jgi:DNA-binding NarL/FixJ family response regulator